MTILKLLVLTAFVIVVQPLLTACGEMKTTEAPLLKISLEKGEWHSKYNIVMLNEERSVFSLSSEYTGLVVGPEAKIKISTKGLLRQISAGGIPYHAIIELPACSSFTENDYSIVDQSDASSLFGLVYSSHKEKRELRQNVIQIPCLKTTAGLPAK
jgi:hypothetical protein